MNINEIIRLSLFDEEKKLLLTNKRKTELLLKILTVYLRERLIK